MDEQHEKSHNLWRFHQTYQTNSTHCYWRYLVCFSMILTYNVRVWNTDQNNHWDPKSFATKSWKSKQCWSLFWLTGHDPQRICAWRTKSTQWIPCIAAMKVIAADFKSEITIQRER